MGNDSFPQLPILLGHWVQLTLTLCYCSLISSPLLSLPLLWAELEGMGVWEACFTLPKWTDGPLAPKAEQSQSLRRRLKLFGGTHGC